MKEGSGRSDALSRQEATSCVPAPAGGDSWGQLDTLVQDAALLMRLNSCSPSHLLSRIN